MNVLGLLSSVFATGGVERINRHVCLALSQFAEYEGHQVRLLSLMDDPDQLDQRYLAGEVSFDAFHGNRLAFVKAVLEEVEMHPDLVYVAHVNLAPLALGMRWLGPDLRYGVALYGIEVWDRLPFLRRHALRQADFITSVSTYTSRQAVDLQNVEAEKINLVPPALDPFWVSDDSNGISDGTDLDLPKGRVLLTVSRLARSEKYKGVDCVIKSLPAVLDHIPDVYYVVVGDGGDLPRLRALAARRGIEDRVLFVGEKTEKLLRAYYRSCDLFVMPSKKEGFGIVFLEAMFYKKAVIGGDHGGTRDVIDNGDTGILVEYGDIAGLSRAIITLLKDEQLASELAQGGYRRLRSTYTFESFQHKLTNVISAHGKVGSLAATG